MRFRRLRASLLGLPALWAVAACATGGVPRRDPLVSPTGIHYPPGTPPTATRYSQTAVLYLRQNRLDRARTLALQGIQEDSANPVHYFIAGVADARLGDYPGADSLFKEAERIYPAYQLQVEPQREAAWGKAFNAGVAAYGDGDEDEAIRQWRWATLMYDLRPEAHRNLASLLAGQGRYDEAIDVYREALDGLARKPATHVLTDAEVAQRKEEREEIEANLAQLLLYRQRYAEAEPLLRAELERKPDDSKVKSDLARALTGEGKAKEAEAIYSGLLTDQGLAARQLFNLGVALFRIQDYEKAAAAFRKLTDLEPESRDAWFNYANSLFAGGKWQDLVNVGARLMELDPLSENAGLITARARLETGDREGARSGLQKVDSEPVHVKGLQMQPVGAETQVHGVLVGNHAPAGSPVHLRFTFYGDSGSIGTRDVTAEAPAKGQEQDFLVTFEGRAEAYRYELVP